MAIKPEVIYKAFKAKPYAATNRDGEIIDLDTVLETLKSTVNDIKALAEYWLFQDSVIMDSLISGTYQDKKLPGQGNEAGRILGIVAPEGDIKVRSRYEKILQDKIVREGRAWASRINAYDGNTDIYMSAGYKRTASDMKPVIYPKISLSAVDKQYAFFVESEIEGVIILQMIAGNDWIRLYFQYDHIRFSGAHEFSLPDIQIGKNGELEFRFSAGYVYHKGDISEKYVVGVDVGIAHYATVSVWNTESNTIVYSTDLSARVHGLENSVRSTNRQVRGLRRRIKSLKPFDSELFSLKAELTEQRQSLSRKRRELAILAAQEIADIASNWDNSLVSLEDLTWRKNTMQNGRWNIGELKHWVNHYVNLNGSRVFNVNAAYTSQNCHQCGVAGKIHIKHRTITCDSCSLVLDRDINAAANIAQRAIKPLTKMVATRQKSKTYVSTTIRRSPVRRESLKYPGRDRTKTGPTNKRISKPCKRNGEVKIVMCSPTRVSGSVVGDDVNRQRPTLKTLEKQHDIYLTGLPIGSLGG